MTSSFVRSASSLLFLSGEFLAERKQETHREGAEEWRGGKEGRRKGEKWLEGRNAGLLMILARFFFAVDTEGMRGAAGDVIPRCRLNGATSKWFWPSLPLDDSSLSRESNKLSILNALWNTRCNSLRREQHNSRVNYQRRWKIVLDQFELIQAIRIVSF